MLSSLVLQSRAAQINPVVECLNWVYSNKSILSDKNYEGCEMVVYISVFLKVKNSYYLKAVHAYIYPISKE